MELNTQVSIMLIDRLIQLCTLPDEDMLSIIDEENIYRLKQLYSWRVITDTIFELEPSISARNHIWCQAISNYLTEQGPPNEPLLIVVGNLHFAGGEGKSLIHLIREQHGINAGHFERYTSAGWIPAEYD